MHQILHGVHRRHIFVKTESCLMIPTCSLTTKTNKQKMGIKVEIHNKPRKFSKLTLLFLNIQME